VWRVWRRQVGQGCQRLVSHHVCLPLHARACIPVCLVRATAAALIPDAWHGSVMASALTAVVAGRGSFTRGGGGEKDKDKRGKKAAADAAAATAAAAVAAAAATATAAPAADDPSLALPLSIVGTFLVMYLFDYSLDNLSLMALTLSVGFVVDDAIVMLENIVRHIENGMRPMEAAFQGSREVAFTILSMTVSLVAVFIPVLFMSGVVGRVFREFAVTISLTILISGLVSLTLTPMLASRLIMVRHAAPNRLYSASQAVFTVLIGALCFGYFLTITQTPQNITAFLTVVWRSGALFGLVPEQAFYVKCDEETNPKDLRDLGYCIVEVGMAPVKPAEFVVFRISQKQDGAGSASE